MSKCCKSCFLKKELNSFYKEKKNKDGLKGICIDCFSEQRKERMSIRKSMISSIYLDKSFLAENKTCILCSLEKTRGDFYKSASHQDGHSPYCKICAQQRERNGRLNNLEEWRVKHAKNQTIWRRRNKEKVTISKRNWKKSRRKRDSSFRIQESLRSRIRSVLAGKCKSASTIKLLGCDVKFFKVYLQGQFKEGMSWENYGLSGWVIDHILPCCSFDLSIEENQRKCFHYSNLRPLWAWENSKKAEDDKLLSINKTA